MEKESADRLGPDAVFLGLRRCRFQVRRNCCVCQIHCRLWIGNRTDNRAVFKLIEIIQNMLLYLRLELESDLRVSGTQGDSNNH